MTVQSKKKTLQWVYGISAVLYAVAFLTDLITLDGTFGNGTYIDLLTRMFPSLIIAAFFCLKPNGISFFFAVIVSLFTVGSGITCLIYHAEMLGVRDIWFGAVYLALGVYMAVASVLLYVFARKNGLVKARRTK